MSKHSTPLQYTKILNILYIIVSLVVMAIFMFVSTAKSDEYIGFFSIALWGTIFAALLVVTLALSLMLRFRK